MALAGSYLDRDEFAARTIAPTSLVQGDFIDPTGAFTDPVKIAARVAWRAFVDATLIIETSKIDARLRKRYAVPFAAPFSEIVRGWLTAIVTPILYRRRGWDPSDLQQADIIAEADKALAELKEAADSNEGLFDLPLRQDNAASAITQGGPYGYAEPGPYDWIDVQRDLVRQ